MPRLKAITLSPTALDRNGISVAETLGAAGSFTIGGALSSGGSVTFTQPQHVTAYAAGANTGITITVTGTDRYGNALAETITGPGAGATVATTQNFATVSDVAASAATTGAVEIGVDGTCESQWFVINYRSSDFNVGIGCELSGTATYSVQHTFNNVLSNGFVEGDATVYTHSTLVGETTNQDGNYTNPPVATRLAITAHTSGTVTMRVAQSGSTG